MAYDPEIDVDETVVDAPEDDCPRNLRPGKPCCCPDCYDGPEDEDGIEYRPTTGTASVIRRAY